MQLLYSGIEISLKVIFIIRQSVNTEANDNNCITACHY